MGMSTFYKYAAELKLNRRPPPHRRKNHHTGIRAVAPLQILHADTTGVITADNQKGYVYLVQDNYSRALLQHTVARHCKAAIAFSNLEQVYEKHLAPAGIESCRLITDDGSENHGEVREFIQSSNHPVITHLIAQKDIEFSNSMIEAANKHLKYRFLYHQFIPDYNALESCIQKAVDDYNNRPHHALHGLTPLEVLNGKIPDKHAFAGLISRAKAARLVENRKIKCCYSF
jgi:transposase InsO family protein